MLFVVTNRALCSDDFLKRLEQISAARPARIILREKDLTDSEYFALAEQCYRHCKTAGIPLALNRFSENSFVSGHLHLPIALFEKYAHKITKNTFCSVSVHSKEEAQRAQALGADYIIAGHIFDTECKKDLAGRGLEFLRDICNSVGVPVYAIGGITQDRIRQVFDAGASGVCVMSALMQSRQPYQDAVQFLKQCERCVSSQANQENV